MEQERLIKEAQKSLRVSPDASARYIQAKDALLDEVNTVMAAHPRITGLIGGNAISMMQDNHRNHIDFMATVFQFNSFEMLAKTIPGSIALITRMVFCLTIFLWSLPHGNRRWKNISPPLRQMKSMPFTTGC